MQFFESVLFKGRKTNQNNGVMCGHLLTSVSKQQSFHSSKT